MSDQDTTTQAPEEETAPVVTETPATPTAPEPAEVPDPETAPTETTVVTQSETPAAESIVAPGVAAPENAQIGDANLAPVHDVEVDVHQDEVPAQVTGAPAVPVETVYVHETSVKLDKVVTDPNSPEAVQIPDAGRGTLDLPIHGLDAPRPEEIFARDSA